MQAYFLEIFVVVIGLALLMVEAFVPQLSRRHLAYAAMSLLLAAFVALFTVKSAPTALWGVYAIDQAALFFKGLALTCTIGVLIVTLEYEPVLVHYLDDLNGRKPVGEYICLPVLLCAGLMWMASMVDLAGLFVSLEFVTITFYVLVGFLRRNTGSLEAATKYLILGALSTGIIVFGLSWVFGLTGATKLRDIAYALQSWQGSYLPVVFAGVLLLIGLAFKVGAVPFHIWIPDVYQGAPTPTTVFLSIGSKAAGFAVLMRIIDTFTAGREYAWVYIALAGMAGITLLLGNLAAIHQDNFKRLLAYSSISHAGFILMGLSSSSTFSGLSPMQATAFYLGAYLLMTMISFIGSAVIRRTADTDELSGFNGLYSRSPLLAIAMLVAAASLAGIPLTAGFWGKFFAFGLAATSHLWVLIVMGVIGAAAGFYYYFKVVRSMFWNSAPAEARSIELLPVTQAALVIASVLLILAGLFPKLILSFVS